MSVPYTPTPSPGKLQLEPDQIILYALGSALQVSMVGRVMPPPPKDPCLNPWNP